jgi:pimeloyl-ACP methyl ester carboxylesterase
MQAMKEALGIILAALLLIAGGCIPTLRPTPEPLRSENYRTGEDEPSCLVVFLHGRGGNMHDFRKSGFIDTVAQTGLAAELVSVDAHLGYYAKRTLVVRLREDIIGPARAGGHDRVWLVGVSMGGLGSLLYARLHPQDVSGVVLLSPFLGDQELIDEIRSAGGLVAWRPEGEVDLDTDYQRDLWRWLKENLSSPDGIPIYLGYGASEQFAATNSVLAEAMPSGKVVVGDGGHNWKTWSPIWTELVNARVLCSR